MDKLREGARRGARGGAPAPRREGSQLRSAERARRGRDLSAGSIRRRRARGASLRQAWVALGWPFVHTIRSRSGGRLGFPRSREVEIKEMQRTSDAVLAAFPATGEVRTNSVDISLRTVETSELIDITDKVRAVVSEADLDEGIALISSPHTTCAVI